MNLGFVNITVILIVLQLFLCALFLFSRRHGNYASHRLLGVFFLTLAINLSGSLTIRCHDFVIQHWPYLFFIGSPFAYLYAPLFYLYVRTLVTNKFRLRRWDVLHPIPFICLTVYLIIKFQIHSIEIKRQMILHGEVIGKYLWIILTALVHIQIIIYLLLCIVLVRAYRKRIRNMYSSIDRINYSWLKIIFFGLFILWLIDMLRFASTVFLPGIFTITEAILFIIFLLLCYAFMYKVMTQPEIFSKIYEIQPAQKSSLSESVRNTYLEKLKSHMDTNKPYLDPDMTLLKLSEAVSIPHRSLSEVINLAVGKNFYDFINAYRIRESERLLLQSNSRFRTVSEILYEVGFNSKSSFQAAFKKNTGMTPSQFKKSHHLAS